MTGNAGLKMKVGLIGAGLQGKRRTLAIKESNSAEVVIVADTDRARAELLAEECKCSAVINWEDVIACNDAEAVIIATPPHLHAPMCLKALEHGKHVLCEKPLARTSEEAAEMVAAARRNGLRLKTGFNLRHHPAIAQAKNLVETGTIGEIIFIRSRYGISGRPDYARDWRLDPEISGGGQLMDQGMHVLDLSRWFLGDFASAFGCLQNGFWQSPAEDNAFALLRTARGQTASLHVSWTQWKNLFSFEVFGREGYIVVEGLGGSYGTERLITGKRVPGEPFKEETIEFRGADRSWQDEWREFVAAIREDREPCGNGDDGLQALRLAETIYDSAGQGRALKIEELQNILRR
jgi:predicted dehydrogenase